MNRTTSSFDIHPSHGLPNAIVRIADRNPNQDPTSNAESTEDIYQTPTEYDTVACSLNFVPGPKRQGAELFDQDKLPYDYENENDQDSLTTRNNSGPKTPRIGDPETDPALQNKHYLAYLERNARARTLESVNPKPNKSMGLIVEIGGAAMRPNETPQQFHGRVVASLQEAPVKELPVRRQD